MVKYRREFVLGLRFESFTINSAFFLLCASKEYKQIRIHIQNRKINQLDTF